jgi:hypothetical protein
LAFHINERIKTEVIENRILEKKFEPKTGTCKKGTVNCRRRRFVIVFLAEHYSGYQMDDKMKGEMCNEWNRRERGIQDFGLEA